MSIVHLPTCPMCKWMMRQVRICMREQATSATRYRVFECMRCHAELMWTPGMDRNVEEASRENHSFRLVPVVRVT
jgi:hypothetical protein